MGILPMIYGRDARATSPSFPSSSLGTPLSAKLRFVNGERRGDVALESALSRLILKPAMEPAKHAKHTKAEELALNAGRTRRVNAVKIGTPSFRVLSRVSRASQSRF